MRTVDEEDRKGRPFISGVMLAAGESTRMGRPKQLLPIGGRPLLQQVLDEAVASSLDEIVIVLGYRAREIEEAIEFPPNRSVRTVINADYADGQSTSLRLGLRSTDRRALGVAVLLGDQLHVTARLIDRLAAVFLTGSSPVVRPLYSRPGSRPVPGHPVFLARRIWPEVEKLDGDHGARYLLSAHPDWVLEIAMESDPPADVDTWDDYQRVVEEEAAPAMGRGRETGRAGGG
jgi:molybdenum cofactor cytidylyltransferase